MRIGLMSGAIVALVLALSGCGGGAEVSVVVPVGPAGPDFDVVAQINGEPIAHLDVFPGESETISVVSGDAFELDSSGPVFWDLSAGGSAAVEAHAGDTFVYQGASLNETAVGDGHLVLAVDSTAPAGSSIPITVTVTSRFDPDQVATIHVLVSN